MEFNWVDYIIFAIFFFSVLSGFGRGLIREIVSLLTLIAAFIVAIAFSHQLAAAFTDAPVVQATVNSASSAIGMNAAQPVSYLALGVSFGVLFAATVLVGAIIGYFLNMAFLTGVVGIGNRVLGAAFGLVRGFLLVLVIMFVVQAATPFAQQSWWQQSQMVNYYQPSIVWLDGMVAPGIATLKNKLNGTLQDVNSSLQESIQKVTN